MSWIPLYCEFAFVEIDLKNIVSIKTINHFKNELSLREFERRDYIFKKMEEKRIDTIKEYNRIENIKAMYLKNNIESSLKNLNENFPFLTQHSQHNNNNNTSSKTSDKPAKIGFAKIASLQQNSDENLKKKSKLINVVTTIQSNSNHNKGINTTNTHKMQEQSQYDQHSRKSMKRQRNKKRKGNPTAKVSIT